MPSSMMLWPESPGLSFAVALILLVLVMFGARAPAHRVIQGIAKAVTQGCKLTSEAITAVQERLAERNREVLMSAGAQETERQIEQEFQRISDAVERDLSAYPALHRQLADQVTRIDEDYRRATDTPPDTQSWAETLTVASQLAEKSGSQTAAAKAVDALRVGIHEAHAEEMEVYRASSRQRHALLSKMVPAWRSMDSTLTRVEKSVQGIFERSRHLDDLMERYREIAKKSDSAERALATSAMTQFLIAGTVLLIALMGGFVNFQLIALPMSEMVGAGSRVGSMPTSDIAALVIILIEVTMGLFLMESLRITRLFPVIGRLDARTRKHMAWATFSLLLILAGIESSLAYMRDLLAADRAALTQTLAGVTAQRPEFMWIPSVGQMVMGFILPFALTFVAIPLESFIHSARSVFGQLGVGLLRIAAFLVHLVGFAADHAGKGLKNAYDIVIFLPLKIEEMVRESRGSANASGVGQLAKAKRATSVIIAALVLSGCAVPPAGNGVFLLVDTSGTYAGELGRAQTVINYLLGTLDPGDSFGVARIDGGSFSEKDILVRMTFDGRPSVANDQKRQFLETVQTFADTVQTASHTDITGGVLQAVEWLNEVGPGVKTVLIFSDMEEDLPEGHIRDFPIELEGVRVIALNVTKLRADNVDPREYAARLSAWQARVEDGGGSWAVVNDLERLDLALEL